MWYNREFLKNLPRQKLNRQQEKIPKKTREIGCYGYLKKPVKITSEITAINFWQQANHPIKCGRKAILQTKKSYLYENAVRANLYGEQMITGIGVLQIIATTGKGLLEINR